MNTRARKGHILTGSGGFTLLELVISFGIIALIVVVIAGAMRLSHRSVESGEKKVEQLERIRASISIVDAQIQSQLPLSYMEDAEKKFYFSGEREQLSFATNYSIWSREKGYSVVAYTVGADAEGKKTLTAAEHTIGLENAREAKLFIGADSLYFEYYFKEPTDETGQWVETWTDKTTLPEKIRLTLIIDKKDFSRIIPMRAALPSPAAAAAAGGGKTPPAKPPVRTK